MARAAIAGSAPQHAGYRHLAAADPATQVQATIVLRGDDSSRVDLLAGRYDPEKRAQVGADAASLEAVESFVRDHGLTIAESNPAEHKVLVRGTADQVKQAFGANLEWFESADGQRYLSYEGDLTLPVEIASCVLAVLGLDQRAVASPR